MHTKSIAALLAATATLALIAVGVQASPSTALADLGTVAEKSLTQVGYEVCQATESESYCRLITDTDQSDEEDAGAGMLDLLGGDDDDE